MPRTNTERVDAFEKAYRAMGYIDADEDPRTCLVDMLADAMHWCDAGGIDFHGAMAMAEIHHDEEIDK